MVNIIEDFKYILAKLEDDSPSKMLIRPAQEALGRSGRDDTSICGDASRAATPQHGQSVVCVISPAPDIALITLPKHIRHFNMTPTPTPRPLSRKATFQFYVLFKGCPTVYPEHITHYYVASYHPKRPL